MSAGLATGEYAWLSNGAPAMTGQATQDHIFVRGVYEDMGTPVTYDNLLSFRSNARQLVWFYLDDSEIYNNEAVQALQPIAYNSAGELYNEITYNAFQMDIYLPQSIELTTAENESGEEMTFERGERMPTSTQLTWGKNDETKTIDGKTYDVYTIVVYNTSDYGSHFSSSNAEEYEQNGALKKDHSLFGLYLRNKNQSQSEGQIDDMILGYMLFNCRECINAEWKPNRSTFFYGQGGNNVEQRFMNYNRVSLYGSKGFDNETANVHASSIELNQSAADLCIGDILQLTATVLPEVTANKTVEWTSSNPSVATVTADGLVTACAAGTATITATTTDGTNLSATCDVTVSFVPIASIELNETNLTLDLSDTYQLVATILPSNASNKTLSWKSSNTSIARVSSNGLVTPLKPGTVTITATTTDGSGLSASCQVVVIREITAITLDESDLTLTLPETAQLHASITPSNATIQDLSWTSSNTAVASVDNNGLVTSVGVGTAVIKATTTDGSNLSATCNVTVRKQYVTSLTLNEDDLVLHEGDTFQLIAEVLPEDASNKTISWVTDNSAVASVDKDGLVTAVASGTAIITAATTDGSHLTASCSVQVIPDYYVTLDTLSHIRGEAEQIADLQLTLVNKNPVTTMQFDVTLPSNVAFNMVNSKPDVWLDENRGTSAHSIYPVKLSTGKYRIYVRTTASAELIGNDGVLLHMNMLLPQIHDIGDFTIALANIIATDAEGTRHKLDNASTIARYCYIVGDADANALVDIADHAATASKILGKSPSPFYSDAANVDGNSFISVADLVGITNIALEIDPITPRQAPERNQYGDRLFCDRLHLNAGGEAEITLGMDCGFNFAGFQMDVNLPDGLTLMDAVMGDEASKLGLATATLPDGRIRILGTSFSKADVDGASPRLLTLKVKADRNYVQGSNIEFSDILFAERNLTSHLFDGMSVEYVEPNSVYELLDEARIYVENGNIIVETPVAGTVQLISVDGRMVEHSAQIGRNVYTVGGNGIYIVHFNGKTIKVRL